MQRIDRLGTGIVGGVLLELGADCAGFNSGGTDLLADFVAQADRHD